MKLTTGKKLVASMVFAALSASQAVQAENTTDVIVKLKNGDAPFSLSASRNSQNTAMSARDLHQVQGQKRMQQVRSFLSSNKIAPKHVYNSVYTGFAATLSESQIEALKNNPNVEAVIPDQMFTIYSSTLNSNAEQRGSYTKKPTLRTEKHKKLLVDWPQVMPQAPLESGASESSYKGAGQHVYVLDTGIDFWQRDLQDNMGATNNAQAACHWPEDKKVCPTDWSDDHSHGTHVAGTIGASDNSINAVGMAPEATLHAVKVCTNAGSCPGSSILAGLDWAVEDMLAQGQPAVANLSLGGPAQADAGVCDENGFTGDNVVAETYCNAAHQGMVIVVAAGNSSDDAAFYNPAGLDSTITVSSYTSYDEFSGEAVFTDFSNYGTGPNDFSDRESGAITIAAPGDSILSLNRTHATTTMSGTSMASPAVAGAAALVMEKFPQAMDFTAFLNVRQMLVDNATVPAFYSTEPDADGNPLNFPHEEGLLNVRFLDEE